MNTLIIGAGAYGLALANVLSEKNNVTVFSVFEKEIEDLNKNYSNYKLFPDVDLSRNIKFTNNVNDAIMNIQLMIIVIPSNFIKGTLDLFKGKLDGIKICVAAKGIDKNTYKFPCEIVSEITNNEISVLSGPSFAIDTIKKNEIILTLAGNNTKEISNIFPTYIKIEESKDIMGTEVCGTIKNIFAISCGILKGLEKCESTKASYLTKIINETKNIIESLNGNSKTIFYACGVGDLLLTCTSEKSRNFSLGVLIGKSENYKKYLEENTVEGYEAIISLKHILNNKNISNELLDIIYEIVIKGNTPTLLLNYILK